MKAIEYCFFAEATKEHCLMVYKGASLIGHFSKLLKRLLTSFPGLQFCSRSVNGAGTHSYRIRSVSFTLFQIVITVSDCYTGWRFGDTQGPDAEINW